MQDLSYTPSYSDILSETETIFEDIVGDLLKKTNTRPDEVDAVITSCSCFAPMPSLAALVVHRFGMRKDVQTYSLAGMGCGASVVCVDMAARVRFLFFGFCFFLLVFSVFFFLSRSPSERKKKTGEKLTPPPLSFSPPRPSFSTTQQLLATLPKGAKIIIVTHENVSQGWYIGNDRSMLLVNCLFRAGGAAALMTNTKRGTGARYMLEHCERTHWACTQEGYDCMGDGEDADGKKGHFIRRSLLPVATDAIKFHLKRLAPHVLTWGELRKAAKDPKYVPRFGKGFEHLLLHTGGALSSTAFWTFFAALSLSSSLSRARACCALFSRRPKNSLLFLSFFPKNKKLTGPAILEAMAGTLGLSKDEISASRKTLQRFGNTSAASTFYTLAHRETLGGVRKGDRLWQLGLGGAFKCNSAIWRAVRNVSEAHPCWAEGVGAVEESELAEIARWRAENAAAAEDAVRRGLVAAPKAPGTGGGFNALAKLDALGAASGGDATVAAFSADTSTEETEVTTSGSGGKIGRGKKVADVPARPVSAAAVAEA